MTLQPNEDKFNLAELKKWHLHDHGYRVVDINGKSHEYDHKNVFICDYYDDKENQRNGEWIVYLRCHKSTEQTDKLHAKVISEAPENFAKIQLIKKYCNEIIDGTWDQSDGSKMWNKGFKVACMKIMDFINKDMLPLKNHKQESSPSPAQNSL